MFNGLFNEGCSENTDTGCNCMWVLLLILFLCCCGKKIPSFNVRINPTCLILMIALLTCCGGLKIGVDYK